MSIGALQTPADLARFVEDRLASPGPHTTGAVSGERVDASTMNLAGRITPTDTAFPAARVFNSVAQSIATVTNTILTFDSERFDTDAIHSTTATTSRLTATTAGVYAISASIEWASVAATDPRHIRLKLNGLTDIAKSRTAAPGGAVHEQSITTLYKLAAGEYVEVEVRQASGGALNVQASGNYSPEFSMAWVAQG